jgi:AcrR family transcriptional regulator
MRERILAAAEVLMHQRGFAGTTLGGLARALRRTKSTLLHHYPHRDALAEALIAHVGAREHRLFAALLERARRQSVNARAALLLYLDDIADMVAVSGASPLAGFAFERDVLGSGPRLALSRASEALLSLHREAFADALREAGCVSPSVPQLAAALQALAEGGQVLAKIHDGEKAAIQALAAFRALIAATLEPPAVTKKRTRKAGPPRAASTRRSPRKR